MSVHKLYGVPVLDCTDHQDGEAMANDTEGKTMDESVTDDGVGLELARATLGELVLRAGFGNERIPITRHGKQTAALIGIRDLEKLRSTDAA